jgi:hypothetical protein
MKAVTKDRKAFAKDVRAVTKDGITARGDPNAIGNATKVLVKVVNFVASDRTLFETDLTLQTKLVTVIANDRNVKSVDLRLQSSF